jgi:hypothetical protein
LNTYGADLDKKDDKDVFYMAYGVIRYELTKRIAYLEIMDDEKMWKISLIKKDIFQIYP